MASTEIKDYWRRAWGLEDRPGFKNGSERVQYKIPTKISDANRATHMGARRIPLDHNWKVQLPDVDGTLFTETFKTKTSANEAIKNAPVTDMDYSKGLLKFDLPEGAVNFDDSRYKICLLYTSPSPRDS